MSSSIPAQYRDRAASVLASLQSYFVEMPRGESFLERSDFESAYRLFKANTKGGRTLARSIVLKSIRADPRVWIVLRAIAALTPPEAASLTMENMGTKAPSISAEVARRVDARCRRGEQVLMPRPQAGTKPDREDHDALTAMATALPKLISKGAPKVKASRVHRLDQFDKSRGRKDLVAAFDEPGGLYAELLYERILGRPYASHRDAVSGRVGDELEDEILELLEDHGIEARKTRAREKVATFPQAPDLLVPSDAKSIGDVEIAIEAKMAEDDGTARDKVARVKALRSNEDLRVASGKPRRQIVAVLDGRGFGVREPDLIDLMEACDGHVYARSEIDQMTADGGPLQYLID